MWIGLGWSAGRTEAGLGWPCEGWLGLEACGLAWVGLLVDQSWLWLLCASGLAWAGHVWVGLGWSVG